MSSTAATAGQLTAQTTEGLSAAPGLPGHPGSHLEWHAAGYQDAMHSVIDLALTLAGRPDSTAQDTLQAVVELALGVIELRRPGMAGAFATIEDAP
jgi:hypothetical protein